MTSLQALKYILLQVSTGPSLICDLFVFIHFIRRREKEIARSPHNHAILLLLVISFIQKITDVPFLLHYLHWGISMRQNFTFCLIWNWIDYTSLSGLLQVLAWFSLERHLFIFHNAWMKQAWCIVSFHYIPLLICLVYAPCFYLVVILLPTVCINTWDYRVMLCGSACYTYASAFVGTFDWLFNYGMPTLIIFLANLLLIYRVLWRRNRVRGRGIRRSQRWMIIQLFYISTLVLSLMLPAVILGVVQVLWSPTFAIDLQYNYFYYIYYFIHQLLPFVIVSSLPETHKDIRRWLLRLRRNVNDRTRIHPTVATVG